MRQETITYKPLYSLIYIYIYRDAARNKEIKYILKKLYLHYQITFDFLISRHEAESYFVVT